MGIDVMSMQNSITTIVSHRFKNLIGSLSKITSLQIPVTIFLVTLTSNYQINAHSLKFYKFLSSCDFDSFSVFGLAKLQNLV